ncbi:MAG: HDIG domain-containing protein, partial [Deltaproteobacteria bacterium]|nr:HDIG domain-containing protein [Deltaproteobacteria bacterium]
LVATARLGGQVDLVLVEGFKGWAGFKIEVFGPKQGPRLIGDPLLIALAGPADHQDKAGQIAFFDRDDAEAMARLVRDCLAPPQRLSPVPDLEACFGLMARFAMPPNILVHSLVVAEAARRLAAALIRAGRRLDLPLTEAGGLLHDIAKAECLERRCVHEVRGAEILTSLGYPHLAEVVARHVDLRLALEKGGLVSPSAIINYADKRVLHQRVVSLEERISDLMTRYGTTPQRSARMAEMAQEARRMETELFKLIDLEPTDLEAINSLFAGPE